MDRLHPDHTRCCVVPSSRQIAQRPAEFAFPRREREVVDERRRGGEAGVKAVLDGTVGVGDGEMRLAGAAGAAGDEAVAVRQELGPEDS